MEALALIMLAVVFAVTLMACASDVNEMRIPNAYSIIVLAAFAAAFVAAPDGFGKWWSHLGALAVFFAITYIMFAAGMIGGGDAKFGSALAIWVGLKGLIPYVFLMAASGGVIAIVSLILKKRKFFANPKPESWIGQLQEGRNAIPYGIAISVGAWFALWQTGFISHWLVELHKIIH